MDGSLFAFAAEMFGSARAKRCLGHSLAIELWVHEKMPTSRLGEEAGTHRVDGGVRSAVASRLTTLPIDSPIVLHGWFLVYRVERLCCAIACGGSVLHSCTAEWARRSRDVLLAVRVRKVRAPEGGMPANGRAE